MKKLLLLIAIGVLIVPLVCYAGTHNFFSPDLRRDNVTIGSASDDENNALTIYGGGTNAVMPDDSSGVQYPNVEAPGYIVLYGPTSQNDPTSIPYYYWPGPRGRLMVSSDQDDSNNYYNNPNCWICPRN